MAADFENGTRGTDRRYPNGERMRDEDIPVAEEEVPVEHMPVEDATQTRSSGRFAPAIVLVAVGAIFLLTNMGLIHLHDVWRYWPILLIVIGVFRLSSRDDGDKATATKMLLVGAVFLVMNLGLIHISFRLLWPLALIGIGLLMFTKSWGSPGFRGYGCAKARIKRRVKRYETRAGRRAARYGDHPFESLRPDADASFSSFVDADNRLENWVLFGGVSRVIMSQNFLGGELIAAFGGIEIDLRRAQIVNTGKPVVIEANAAFGGISIKVPDTWRIAVRGVGIFGGYQDESVKMRNPDPTAPLLIISGYAAFGGVVIE